MVVRRQPMRFTNLLGQGLKSDAVVALLEQYEIDVTYDFDRLHEGAEDRYWASFKEQINCRKSRAVVDKARYGKVDRSLSIHHGRPT
jgi:hypothetical protein